MKKLVIINGAPGVGKTTVCKALNQKIKNSVWLDGDWCWMINPFQVTEENKIMVEDNITHLLKNFLGNRSIETIIFNWVIPHDDLMNSIIGKLPVEGVKIIKISLISSEEVLSQRMMKDGRPKEKIEESIKRLEAYWHMDTIKVDSSALSIEQTAERINELIKI
ncbi:AAA family ATPase [Fusibacter ferrireducens]|uniref:AAA family ATPase n=1 Tax=Fusibacter ferrireducens TaxID=2785058 RepID=A0ABS0A288_9FIRM|nr:AAA family ATPase [Fusibacter ferrireducens]MBF4695989.1 AAA family ATPase [Fusibacter ferrireducens]